MGEHNNDLTYCELRAKEIINTCDGRRLGRIVDIVFSCTGSDVKGIVVPFTRKIFFSKSQEIFIPWRCIDKIGEDVILVALQDSHHPHKNDSRGFDFDHHDRDRGHEHEHRKDPCRDGCPPPKHHDDCRDDRRPPHHDDCRDDRRPPHHDDCRPPHNDWKERDKHDGPRCDKKCEKCMLFDCAYRWKD